MQYFETLRSWQRKKKNKKHQAPKLQETDRETKRNQKNKRGKVLLLFNKIGKGCILDKNRKVLVIEVVQSTYKGSFITEGIFYFF